MQRDSYTTIALIHAPVSVIPAKAGIHAAVDSRLRGKDGVPAGMSGYDRA